MEERRNILRNQKGFTLIEIIAVLVILGILAAVAVPKYLDLQANAKARAAEGQVAEIKGTLATAWGKQMLSTGGVPPTIAQIIAAVGTPYTVGTFTVGAAPDLWSITLADNTTNLGITINNKNGDSVYTATGTWNLP